MTPRFDEDWAFHRGLEDSSDLTGTTPPKHSGAKQAVKRSPETNYDAAWKEYLKEHPDVARKAEKIKYR